MSDIEKFLQDTLALPHGDKLDEYIHCYMELALVDPKEWAELMEQAELLGMYLAARASDICRPLKHPKRKGEWVGHIRIVNYRIELTPEFVRECMEAARHGKNPLIAFVNKQTFSM